MIITTLFQLFILRDHSLLRGKMLYTSKDDIENIGKLMQDIREEKISRNKNYFTLSKIKEHNLFKRAKLLISLVDDLNRTMKITGNKIDMSRQSNLIEIK